MTLPIIVRDKILKKDARPALRAECENTYSSPSSLLDVIVDMVESKVVDMVKSEVVDMVESKVVDMVNSEVVSTSVVVSSSSVVVTSDSSTSSSNSSIKTKEEYSSCKAIPTTFLDVRVMNSRKRKKAGNCIMFKA